jgi:creatinine amidohydrolase
LSDVYHEIFTNPDDHAGEMETSFALAYLPDLVARDEAGKLTADEGHARRSRFEAINRKWIGITRPWHLLTTNSGCGDPHSATAEKGEKLMAGLRERLVPFLVELAASPIDETFPFEPS